MAILSIIAKSIIGSVWLKILNIIYTLIERSPYVPISWIQYIGGEWVGGGAVGIGDEWKAKGRLYHPTGSLCLQCSVPSRLLAAA